MAARLYADVAFRQQLADFVTINVSEFFRNPERYEDLSRRFLPELLRGRPSLRVWSAGCSIGAEPYYVAMLLQELATGGRHSVLGTDIDAPRWSGAGRPFTGMRSCASCQRPSGVAISRRPPPAGALSPSSGRWCTSSAWTCCGTPSRPTWT